MDEWTQTATSEQVVLILRTRSGRDDGRRWGEGSTW